MAGDIQKVASLPASSAKSDFHDLVDNATIRSGVVTNDMIAAAAGIPGSKLDLSTPGVIGATSASAATFTKTTKTSEHFTETTAPTTAAGEGAVYTKDTSGQPELFFREESSGDEVQLTSGGNTAGGVIKQIVSTETGTVNTGTTAMPSDDTTPQNDEGDEYMTLAITPTSTTTKLRIDVALYFSHSTSAEVMSAAIFQDLTANALAAHQMQLTAAVNSSGSMSFSHVMTSGTTSETTFKVRLGGASGATTTFNGINAGQKFNGVGASSIIITEYSG